MYALAGLADEHEFNEISTMPMKKLLARALVWDHMSGHEVNAEHPFKCGCGSLTSFVCYPEFIVKVFKLERVTENYCFGCRNRITQIIYKPISAEDVFTQEKETRGNYCMRYSERLTRSQRTIKVLESLAALESSQPTTVIAAELDDALNKLSNAERENKRLTKLLDDIKSKFS
jgi:hypothetical protein